MVRLHALQSHAEHTATCEVDRFPMGDDSALNLCAGPECVPHRSPRSLRIGAIFGCAIRSAHEARSRSLELDVYVGLLVTCRLDVVGRAIFRELDGEAVGEEGELVIVKAVVLKRIARPDNRLLVVGIPELDVELCSDTQAAG